MRLSRLLLVLVLMLAVPLQGLASAGVELCATGHHEEAGDPHGHQHQHHDKHGAPSGNAHCTTCASCCIPAAVSSVPLLHLAELADKRIAPARADSYSGVAPSRLERPPLAL